jgi:hypothetical protein
MSTIKSVETLGFYPAIEPALARFGGALRTYWAAMHEGLDAAAAYRQLTAQGTPHDVAVRKVFDEHFA